MLRNTSTQKRGIWYLNNNIYIILLLALRLWASQARATRSVSGRDITDTFIDGINGAPASAGAAVFVVGEGHLGTLTSSARFKDEIKPMDKASEAILALKPVSFR